jgi:hypothetical protein
MAGYSENEWSNSRLIRQADYLTTDSLRVISSPCVERTHCTKKSVKELYSLGLENIYESWYRSNRKECAMALGD